LLLALFLAGFLLCGLLKELLKSEKYGLS